MNRRTLTITFVADKGETAEDILDRIEILVERAGKIVKMSVR